MRLASRKSPEEIQRQRARHRRGTRLGLLALALATVGLAGLMYFDTTAIAPGRAALVMRGGELRHVVTDAGRVYRVPILDRILLIDLRPQPLPTLRSTVVDRDGARAVVELRVIWQVADAGVYWTQLKAAPQDAARLIEAEIDRALRARITGMAAAPSAEARQALAAAIEADSAPGLAQAGVRLSELRVVSLQVLR